ncbi:MULTISPECIES: citrate/2-methylcitrate synthase [unclassified Variovorax]|uniref:citrate/2-methylcitrate synthase n=1 Tax=unclassified Variovorax TaxID=663243 RepID=UPI001BD54B3B|nr:MULTISPECIES: citrate/2-methylcitrate synthase [unclassified Variovorax]
MKANAEFRSGLEGVIVAETEISHVDGENGRLIYRGGNAIESLVNKSYEEVAFLLLYGWSPNPSELSRIREEFAKARHLGKSARLALSGLPPVADPMDALRTVLSAQGAERNSKHINPSEALQITAVAATAIAAFQRQRLGLTPVLPHSELGHVANFMYMLRGTQPEEAEVRWLEAYFVVTADHALSPSTFTAQVVGSTGSDLWSSVVAAICALKGPAHGGAIAEATRMLEQVGTPERAEVFVAERFARNERIMGFGHREYRKYDPRARILADVCRLANPAYHELALAVEHVVLRELNRRHPDRPNFTNMDYFAGGVLSGVGIAAELFPCVFAASRTLGWSAHVIEYIARGGRIVSPASSWAGPALPEDT